MSKNDVDDAVTVFFLISSSGGYINGTQVEKLGLIWQEHHQDIYTRL